MKKNWIVDDDRELRIKTGPVPTRDEVREAIKPGIKAFLLGPSEGKLEEIKREIYR